MKAALQFYAAGMIAAAISVQHMPTIIPEDLSPSAYNDLQRNMVGYVIFWPAPVINSLLPDRY